MWFWYDPSPLHSLCPAFLFLLHQVHLRSSGMRSWRLGTPRFKPLHLQCCMRAALANSFSASVGTPCPGLGLCLEQDGGGHLGDRGTKGGLIPSSKLTLA